MKKEYFNRVAGTLLVGIIVAFVYWLAIHVFGGAGQVLVSPYDWRVGVMVSFSVVCLLFLGAFLIYRAIPDNGFLPLLTYFAIHGIMTVMITSYPGDFADRTGFLYYGEYFNFVSAIGVGIYLAYRYFLSCRQKAK